MSEGITIAVDALGGDNAPEVVLQGVEQALAESSELSVILCGPADVVEPFAAAHEHCTAQVATEVIDMAEHPANAVRKKKDSSIVVGCRLVKEGAADGFFSAGSTGACLAAATLVTGRIKGIARPALVTVLPASTGPVVFTDVGANADCKPEYLVQFAQMGAIYAREIMKIPAPRVGLLNIGEEETKGSQFAQEAHALMAEKVEGFTGNAEGRDLTAGTFDVVVTDGFTGNVCLKTIEGVAKMLFGEIKTVMKGSFFAKLGALAMKKDLYALKDRLDPDVAGGAPLLGVKGAVVVGHGSSGAKAIKNGVLATERLAKARVSELIAQTVEA